MRLTSPAFSHGGKIPRKYTCDGGDINPPLEISGTPLEAKSLVLIVEDPDVPLSLRADGLWVHWLVFDIGPRLREIVERSPPFATYGKGTTSLGYQGPCPPDSEHRYFFKLYALDTLLKLPRGSSKKEVEDAMQGHILEKTELMGTYERK